MTRISYVYPRDGSEPFVKGSRGGGMDEGAQGAQEDGKAFPTILPDLPDFVSPIDGRSYSGRRGLREHCAKHNVIPNADLKGLPMMQTNSDFRSPEQRRASAEERKRIIINEVNRHYR